VIRNDLPESVWILFTFDVFRLLDFTPDANLPPVAISAFVSGIKLSITAAIDVVIPHNVVALRRSMYCRSGEIANEPLTLNAFLGGGYLLYVESRRTSIFHPGIVHGNIVITMDRNLAMAISTSRSFSTPHTVFIPP
jgi:hypothetical protein